VVGRGTIRGDASARACSRVLFKIAAESVGTAGLIVEPAGANLLVQPASEACGLKSQSSRNHAL
jgi:hypothetical protein